MSRDCSSRLNIVVFVLFVVCRSYAARRGNWTFFAAYLIDVSWSEIHTPVYVFSFTVAIAALTAATDVLELDLSHSPIFVETRENLQSPTTCRLLNHGMQVFSVASCKCQCLPASQRHRCYVKGTKTTHVKLCDFQTTRFKEGLGGAMTERDEAYLAT